ncbi:LuxR C-terminal-related transcriptional regulator [Streptomyces sp. ET3-23]|uniref:ATP-binding protein n=1 Tax=Streptomyces sp. ET3-23 TaxID=2885643 RepID=UPI001D12701F|nr:LuxR C-terminal-related transcriptional regulator [Streptomyces sp. ET3-23]MCC2276964.1 LuxR C-terminal-related transcriptional regulator [Streptomyces sp. ET3-23]
MVGGPRHVHRAAHDGDPDGTAGSALSPLFGRAADIEQLCRRITAGHRLTTLTGPVGVGKSRLAAAVGEQLRACHRHRVHTVDFAPSPGAAGHGAPGPGTVDPLPGSGGRQLLIMDNCEFAAPELAFAVVDLLMSDDTVDVLATRRSPLGVHCERLFPVRPLPTPRPGEVLPAGRLVRIPSVALLLHAVAAIRPDFTVTEGNRSAIADLCHELDGLPLALEYAAARFRIHEPATLAAAVRSGLEELTGGRRIPPWRHTSLRTALAEHLHTLSPDATALLKRLARLETDFTLHDAEAAGSRPAEARRLLETLVDQQFVQAHEEGDGQRRFSLLRTTRTFLREAGHEPPCLLTRRQRQVAELVALGLTNRAIARRLGISEWTAVNHVRQVLKKLEVSSRVEVASWVAQRGACAPRERALPRQPQPPAVSRS